MVLSFEKDRSWIPRYMEVTSWGRLVESQWNQLIWLRKFCKILVLLFLKGVQVSAECMRYIPIIFILKQLLQISKSFFEAGKEKVIHYSYQVVWPEVFLYWTKDFIIHHLFSSLNTVTWNLSFFKKKLRYFLFLSISGGLNYFLLEIY